MGPTPPGTGVIAPATADHGLEVDVAGEAVLGAVHADVDHGRAGLHHLGGHEARDADRRHQHVRAPRHGRRGPGCASGRPSRWRSRAAAAPRPACRPGRCARRRPPRRPRALRRPRAAAPSLPRAWPETGRRVRGRAARRSTAVRPSTSLSGSIVAITSAAVQVGGQRELDQDAVDLVVRVQLGDQVDQVLLRRCRPAARGRSTGCRLRRRPCACWRRICARPGRRRPAPSRAPAVPRRPPASARPPPRPPRARAAAIAFPSMTRALNLRGAAAARSRPSAGARARRPRSAR